MDNIKEIIKDSTFEVQEGEFIYCKVKSAPLADQHFMVTTDQDETTVVTQEKNLPGLDLIERNKDNYTLIALNVSIPFYSVGFLATVTAAIAKSGMNVLVVSTYSKDYIIVKVQDKDKVLKVLSNLGFKK